MCLRVRTRSPLPPASLFSPFSLVGPDYVLAFSDALIPKECVFSYYRLNFAGESGGVSFGRFAQRIASFSFCSIAMCGFDTKLLLDVLDKCQTSNAIASD